MDTPMKPPLISVVMPVYNAEVYLKRAIDSILNQEYPHLELILIDDGSTDNSKDILLSYQQDPRVLHITHESNQGIVKTLNLGVAAAKGKYIARMDADDFSLPERLARQLTFLEANPAIRLCGSSILTVPRNNDIQNWIHEEKGTTLHMKLLFFNPIAHPTVMMDAALAKDLLYEQAYLYAEDYRFWSKFAERAQLANMGEPLLEYTLHANSTSQSKKEAQLLATQKVVRENLSKWLQLEPSEKEMEIHLTLGGYANYAGKEYRTELNNWSRKLKDQNKILKKWPSGSFEAFVDRLAEQSIQKHPPSSFRKVKQLVKRFFSRS